MRIIPSLCLDILFVQTCPFAHLLYVCYSSKRVSLCWNEASCTIFLRYYFCSLPTISFKLLYTFSRFVSSFFLYIFVFYHLNCLQTWSPLILTTVWYLPLQTCSIRTTSSQITTLSGLLWRTCGLGRPLSPLWSTLWVKLRKAVRAKF